MTAKTLWVTFTSATPVPAAVLGEAKDRRMPIGEPVELPAAYGAQMVADRFAAAVDAPVAPKTAAKTAAKTQTNAATATLPADPAPLQASLNVDPGGAGAAAA